MRIRRGIWAAAAICVCAGWACAQDATEPTASLNASPVQTADLTHRPAEEAVRPIPFVSLAVPKGASLQVALDKDVRVKHEGQPIEGRIVEPVYAFDKLVIPTGARVTGRIIQIEEPSKGKRTAAALDADFSPARATKVEFDHVYLPDGKPLAMRTIVTVGSGQLMEFVSAADENQKKGAKDAAAEKVKEAKQEAKQEWNSTVKDVEQTGKMRRAEKYVLGQLPVHPQYIDAGTVYFAELDEPLDFGSEPLTPEMAQSIGSQPPQGSMVEARLVTPLSSANSKLGETVEAVVSRPLFDGDRLVLPQGSRITGTVVQVEPARHPGRNGELRIVFRDLHLPDGVDQKIAASLEGVESAKRDNVKLDSEGGAKATAPPTRFLTVGTSVALAGASFLGDSFGETGPRAAGGAGGYKLIGIALGLTVHSQPFGMAMGTFGAGRAIYANFIARGHDVVFPKNTAMALAIERRQDIERSPILPTQETTSRD
jgi:type IV secretory pathway VirB10-like protein